MSELSDHIKELRTQQIEALNECTQEGNRAQEVLGRVIDDLQHIASRIPEGRCCGCGETDPTLLDWTECPFDYEMNDPPHDKQWLCDRCQVSRAEDI